MTVTDQALQALAELEALPTSRINGFERWRKAATHPKQGKHVLFRRVGVVIVVELWDWHQRRGDMMRAHALPPDVQDRAARLLDRQECLGGGE